MQKNENNLYQTFPFILFLSLYGLSYTNHTQFTEFTPNTDGESASNFLLATDTPDDYLNFILNGQIIAFGVMEVQVEVGA